MQFVELLNPLNHAISQIGKGIESHPQMGEMALTHAKLGLTRLIDINIKSKEKLSLHYTDGYPASFEDIFRYTDHILDKFSAWIKLDSLKNSMEADTYLEAFTYKMEELKILFKEIDSE